VDQKIIVREKEIKKKRKNRREREVFRYISTVMGNVS
jgi:hypothetical protein